MSFRIDDMRSYYKSLAILRKAIWTKIEDL